MENPESKAKMEAIGTRFFDLVSEVNILKPIIETIVCIRIGLRRYLECKGLDDSLNESQSLAEKRLMEIGDLLKLMKKESEIVTSFLKEPPQGGVN